MTATTSRTRRTEGTQSGERAARVVEDVLHATATELSRVGYARLRVEDVAAKSGVNKTTIYRRWPTKPELVAAAIQQVVPKPEPRDTGDVREDLASMALETVALCVSPEGRGIIRIMQAERSDPEVEKVAQILRRRGRKARTVVLQRAVDRGDLPHGASLEFVGDMIFSPIHARLTAREPVDRAFVEAVIDTVLAGVRSMAPRSAK